MELIFVYNAQSGYISTAIDMLHKLISPETYSCNLCRLTFGRFSEKQEWNDFRKSAGIPMSFYHIDEFEKKFPITGLKYPVLLVKRNTQLEEFIDSSRIDQIKTTAQLIKEIKLSIHSLNQPE